MKYQVVINNRKYKVEIKRLSGNRATVTVNGGEYDVEITGGEGSAVAPAGNPLPAHSSSPPTAAAFTPRAAPQKPSVIEKGVIRAPMPGTVLDVLVKVGQRVRAGDVVIRIESMKMENEIITPSDGIVREVRVSKGDEVQEHDILIILGEIE